MTGRNTHHALRVFCQRRRMSSRPPCNVDWQNLLPPGTLCVTRPTLQGRGAQPQQAHRSVAPTLGVRASVLAKLFPSTVLRTIGPGVWGRCAPCRHAQGLATADGRCARLCRGRPRTAQGLPMSPPGTARDRPRGRLRFPRDRQGHALKPLCCPTDRQGPSQGPCTFSQGPPGTAMNELDFEKP